MIEGVPEDQCWRWLGFTSASEPRPVQAWIDEMKRNYPDHFYAVKDQLARMQVTPRDQWEEPFFDPLDGEGGISEIRFDPPIRGELRFHYYRIYGFFDEDSVCYIFLHGTDKRRRNDKDGKATAKRRLGKLRSNEAALCEISLD
jgi:hypothetical protein